MPFTVAGLSFDRNERMSLKSYQNLTLVRGSLVLNPAAYVLIVLVFSPTLVSHEPVEQTIYHSQWLLLCSHHG